MRRSYMGTESRWGESLLQFQARPLQSEDTYTNKHACYHLPLEVISLTSTPPPQTQFNKPSPHLPNYPASPSVETPTQEHLCAWHHSAVPAREGVLQHSSHEVRSENINAVSLFIPQYAATPASHGLSQVIFTSRWKSGNQQRTRWQFRSRVFHINLHSGAGRDLVSHPHPHPFIPVGHHCIWHQSCLTAVAEQEGQDPGRQVRATQTHLNALKKQLPHVNLTVHMKRTKGFVLILSDLDLWNITQQRVPFFPFLSESVRNTNRCWLRSKKSYWNKRATGGGQLFPPRQKSGSLITVTQSP